MHRTDFTDSPLAFAVAAPRSAPVATRLLLIEEHLLIRTALRALLDATPGLSVVAQAGSCDEAVPVARTHRPEVVLVSGQSIHRASDAFIAALRQASPGACILFLSDGRLSKEGVSVAGVHGCLSVDAGVTELCEVVASALGSRCASCAIRPHCPAPQIAVALSRRERQVAVRVAEGMMSKQIAASLGVSLRTVHTYRESLARKLGASSAAVLTRFVLQSGLTDESFDSAVTV